MTQQITGIALRSMLINGYAAIESHKSEVNDLNVFPVPDGDTGTNMSLTMGAGAKALEKMTSEDTGHVAEATASALLRGARGNSGVILSLLFRGIARALKDHKAANAIAFAAALENGVSSAYKAVMRPTEGTILTVSRIIAETAMAESVVEDDVELVLERALEAGEKALARTTEQNPVLKKAGVVDAGAKGYIYILDGMLKALRGVVIEYDAEDTQIASKADFTSFKTEDIKFVYCTEFIVSREQKRDPLELRNFLEKLGDSIVVADDEEIIKVHVHTNTPGVVLTEALTYGALLTVKIENMREQHTENMLASGAEPESSSASEPISTSEVFAEPERRYGTVAVCAGAGIEDVFRDLGADNIITGGQTMNPSTDDILKQINETPAETVFVLPNNKNIIMAAQQCAALTEKKVVVIPSRTIPQGIAAMLALDPYDDNAERAMTEAIKRVHTALITCAARDSVYDEQVIFKDEYLALVEDSLVANGPDINEIFTHVSRVLVPFSPEFITIFTGEGAAEHITKCASDKFSEKFPDAEISVVPGGQPVYAYMISAE